MKKAFIALIAFLSLSATHAQHTRHVILISIDGLHPDMYLDKAWPTPNLQQLMKRGTYATRLLSTFPSYTYPSHTAMLTGALPARSKVYFNQPKGSHGEWNWFAAAIKVPTLWQALKTAGETTAAIEWPATAPAGTGADDITWNLPEIWSLNGPGDRISEARKYATPGLVDKIEREATGILDSTNMNDEYFSLDENIARAAAWVFKTYKPGFLALHFACVDGAEHEQGRTGDSVSLAIQADDRAIGYLLGTIRQTGLQDSTTIIIVGDHGFSTIHHVIRPNLLVKELPAHFIASGGSAFLYLTDGAAAGSTVASMIRRLDSLPAAIRHQFRIMNRVELDQLGADSNAVFALSATPGTVFSNATSVNNANAGPGTVIQQGTIRGVYGPTHGGHHGYDPRLPDMWTGFIAAGPGIKKGARVEQLSEPDIAPLIAALLGISFACPDGKLVPGVMTP